MIPHWLARAVTVTVVRRLVLLALAAALAWCGMGKAQAQTPPESGSYPDKATAWIACESYRNSLAPPPAPRYRRCILESTTWWRVFEYTTGDVVWTPQGGSFTFPGDNGGCPAGTEWVEATHECKINNCATAPEYGGAQSSSLYMCNGGCRYEQAATAGISVCLGSGEGMTCFADKWKATGAFCSPNDTPPQAFDSQLETCQSLGVTTYSECVKPNGDHCVTSATGAVLCWHPNETGPRMTTDGKTGADREIAPTTPTPPPNQADPTSVTTTTTTINGNTYNTTTFTGSGNTGGQGNVGGGGKNTGGTGDPKGDGSGNGSGNGSGEGEGDDDGPGGVGGGIGDVYEGSDKTIASVFNTFKGQVEASPLIGAAGNFLTVSVSASCPTFSVPETAFWSAMEFTYHCSGPLADALALGAYLLLAVAAYTAFKIGFG